MHDFPGSIDRVLREDELLNRVRAALLPAPTGEYYVCGLYVADALAGMEPAGLLLATARPAEETSRSLASALGAVVVRLKRGWDVYVVCVPGRPARNVTVVPLGSGGINSLLRRAAFTVCGMAFDLTGPGRALVDPFGGLQDLENGRLRMISEDSDSISLNNKLMAVEICIRYGLDVREVALRGSSIGHVGESPRRIWKAIARLMTGNQLSRKVRMLKRMGVLGELFPELESIYDVPQNYYHHLGVWEHTMEVIDRLEDLVNAPSRAFSAFAGRIDTHLREQVEGGVDRRAFLSFAALVHDVGKAATMSMDASGRIRFKDHQRAGARLVEGIASRMGLGYRGRSLLVGIVRNHMSFGFLIKDGETIERRMRAVREMGSSCVEVVLLSLADRLATRGEASTTKATEGFGRTVSRVLADFYWDRERKELAGGRDVLLHTGVPPGPDVSRWLFDVRVAQREGVVSNQRQALEFMAPDFKGRIGF